MRQQQFHVVANHQDVICLAAAPTKILIGSSAEGREPAHPHNHGRNDTLLPGNKRYGGEVNAQKLSVLGISTTRESAESSTCRDSLLHLDKYLEHNHRVLADLGKRRIRDAETANTRTRGRTSTNNGQRNRTSEKEKKNMGWVAFEPSKSFYVASASSCSSCDACSTAN